MSFSNGQQTIIGLETTEDRFDLDQLPELRTCDSLDYIAEMMDSETMDGGVSTVSFKAGKRPQANANKDTDEEACMSLTNVYANSLSINFHSTPHLETSINYISTTNSKQDGETPKPYIEHNLSPRVLAPGILSHCCELQCEHVNTSVTRNTERFHRLPISTFNSYKEADLNQDESEIQLDLLSFLNQCVDETSDSSYRQYMLPLEIFDTPAPMKKSKTKGSNRIGKSIDKDQNRHSSSTTKFKKAKRFSSKRFSMREKDDLERNQAVSRNVLLPTMARFRTQSGKTVDMRVEALLRQALKSLYHYLCHAFGMFAWYAVGSRTYQCEVVDDENSARVLTKRKLENEILDHLASEGALSERGLQLAAKRIVHNRKYEALCPFCECIFKSKFHFECHKLHYDKM